MHIHVFRLESFADAEMEVGPRSTGMLPNEELGSPFSAAPDRSHVTAILERAVATPPALCAALAKSTARSAVQMSLA